jgi:hypothetical protein
LEDSKRDNWDSGFLSFLPKKYMSYNQLATNTTQKLPSQYILIRIHQFTINKSYKDPKTPGSFSKSNIMVNNSSNTQKPSSTSSSGNMNQTNNNNSNESN